MNNNNEKYENDLYFYDDDDLPASASAENQRLLSSPSPPPSPSSVQEENIMSLPIQVQVEIFLHLGIEDLFALASEFPCMRNATKVVFRRKFADCLVVMARIGTRTRDDPIAPVIDLTENTNVILVQGYRNALMFSNLFGEDIGRLVMYEDGSQICAMLAALHCFNLLPEPPQ